MPARPPLFLHAYDHPTAWSLAAAQHIAQALSRHLASHGGSARFFVSGGTTPAPVYEALAHHPLDWARILINLADERWLAPDQPASNASLIQRHLLHSLPHCHFMPLVRPGLTIDACVTAANQVVAQADLPAVAVLGMGDDGHTASLFPAAPGLHAALTSQTAYAALDATGCPGANQWPLRITLTPFGMASAAQRILLIRGEQKRAVLDAALASTDRTAYPIRVAIDHPGEPLHVFWCP